MMASWAARGGIALLVLAPAGFLPAPESPGRVPGSPGSAPAERGPGIGAAGTPAESVAALARRLLPAVESLRGLRFRHPVPIEIATDSTARAHFASRLEKVEPAEQLRAETRAYEQLGLLPPGTDLQDLLLGVLEEQAGGYYDPQTERFYVMGDVPPTVLELVLTHELVHALDDQHFDLDSTLAAFADDEDREAAYDAVVEGSATLVMNTYMLRELEAGRLDPESLLELQQSDFGRAEKLDAAPPVLRRALLAPYLLGEYFLRRGRSMLGTMPHTADLDRAFRAPPASFEQILHPEKYWDAKARDVPRPMPDVELGAALGAGWKRLGDGTLGEILLAPLTGAGDPPIAPVDSETAVAWTTPAASGWGNDRWWLWGKGERRATILATLWDSERDAREFAAAVRAPAGARVVRRRDAVILVVGDLGDAAKPVANVCLDAVARAAERH